MLTRRDLIVTGALASVGSTNSGSLQAAEMHAYRRGPTAAISRLKSRYAEAQPISRAEREQRHVRARELMAKNGLDAIVLTGGTSLEYFAGISWSGGERLFAMVLPAQKNFFFVCPAFEETRSREQLSLSQESEDLDFRLWQEDESPYARLAEGLRDRHIGTGGIGGEETVKFVFSQGIGAAVPNATLLTATPVTAGCRMIKTIHELALMRLANEVTLAAIGAVYQSIQVGMTRQRIEQLVVAAHEKLGFHGEADVTFDQSTASPHGSEQPQSVRDGSIVMIDGGCKVHGYQSDITRTFCVGSTPRALKQKMTSAFEIVHRAQSAALAAARRGVVCEVVEAAARKVIIGAGYGPDYRFSSSRLGHGIGMDMHEWPYLVRGNSTKLQENMTTSNEPGLYFPLEFGVRPEDYMFIGPEGTELFKPPSPSLDLPFGS